MEGIRMQKFRQLRLMFATKTRAELHMAFTNDFIGMQETFLSVDIPISKVKVQEVLGLVLRLPQ